MTWLRALGKTGIHLGLLGVLMILCSSCVDQIQHGYPLYYEFKNSGGTAVVPGSVTPNSIVISENGGNSETSSFYPGIDQSVPNDISASFQWLSALTTPGSNKVVLTAQPNETGHDRTLYLDGMLGDEYFTIKVTQKK